MVGGEKRWRRKEREESEREGEEVAVGVARRVEEGAERGRAEGCEALGGGESRLRLRRVLLEALLTICFAFFLSTRFTMAISRYKLYYSTGYSTSPDALRTEHRTHPPRLAKGERRNPRPFQGPRVG